jgi:hypothetical protein
MPGHRSVPEKGPESFVPASSGLEKPLLAVENHDQEGAVQNAFAAVARVVIGRPHNFVILIHDYEIPWSEG